MQGRRTPHDRPANFGDPDTGGFPASRGTPPPTTPSAMTMTADQADGMLENARKDVTNARQEAARGKALYIQAQSRLANWAATYGEVSAWIDAELAAHPNKIAAKDRADKRDDYAANRAALKADIDAAVNALNAI